MNAMRRRDLLAAFLGAPAMLAFGGCQSAQADTPPGELHGATASFGHRLRDAIGRARPAPPAEIEQQTQVVIIGTGIAGLAAARRLESQGVRDFVVLELESLPGGKSVGGRSKTTPFPLGAHYVPSPRKENEPLVEFFEELGAFEGRDEHDEPIPQEHWLVRDPESRIFFKGVWYEGLYLHPGASARDLEQFQRFRERIDHWVGWRDSQDRPAFAIPSSTASRDPEVLQLDGITMAKWLEQQGFDSPRLKWYVDYACRDDYGMTSETTSAWAGLFYFAARKLRPGGPSQPFMTWPEGNAYLVQRMFQPLRSRTELGWAAAQITPTPSQDRPSDERAALADIASKSLDVLAINAEGQRRWIRAARVIFAAPQFLAPYLLPGLDSARRQAAQRFEYSSWAVANLHLSGRPESEGFPLCWDNVLYESPSLGYVTATHQRGPEHGPTVLTYYYPLCGADPNAERKRLLEASREDWAEIALLDLGAAHQNLREVCTQADIARWGHAMVRPTVGFISGLEAQLARQPHGRVHFGHSDLSGLPLFEEAFDQGFRAANEVIAALKEEGAA